MRLLLDTHVLIGLSTATLSKKHPDIASGIDSGRHDLGASVASLWEIAIKTRLGKLDPSLPPVKLAAFFETAGVTIIPITTEHVVTDVLPEPSTNDPFDRLLLAQCRVESRYLVTMDRALVGHPLAAGRLGN